MPRSAFHVPTHTRSIVAHYCSVAPSLPASPQRQRRHQWTSTLTSKSSSTWVTTSTKNFYPFHSICTHACRAAVNIPGSINLSLWLCCYTSVFDLFMCTIHLGHLWIKLIHACLCKRARAHDSGRSTIFLELRARIGERVVCMSSQGRVFVTSRLNSRETSQNQLFQMFLYWLSLIFCLGGSFSCTHVFDSGRVDYVRTCDASRG